MKKQSTNARSAATNSKPELRLDWCSHEAAKYAVEKWHYTRSMPPPPRVSVGVWENEVFCGVVMFARGATGELMTPYGLSAVQGCELVRIALSKHATPVSRIVSVAVKFLLRSSPGLRLIVSFADPGQGHHGGIYQAGNWIYAGKTAPSSMYEDKNGKLWHERMISKTGRKKVFGEYREVLRPDECKRIRMQGKHRYLMPLDTEMAAKVSKLAQPYPKRAASESGDTSANHAEKGGSIPTAALSKKTVAGKKAKGRRT